MAQVRTASLDPMGRQTHLNRHINARTMPVYEPAMQEHRSRPVDDDTLCRALIRVLLDGVDDYRVTVAFAMLCAKEGI